MPQFQFDQESGRRRTTVDVLPPNRYLINPCILNHNPCYLSNVNEDSLQFIITETFRQ